MKNNRITLALLALIATSHTIGAKIALNNGHTDGSCVRDLSDMVKESSPSALGLRISYENMSLDNVWFGGYCHLYASNCLLASACMIKCFYYQNNLIVFLGDFNGYIKQIKVFKSFNRFSSTIDVCYKQYLPSAIYKPQGLRAKDLIKDIDTAKLASTGAPLVLVKQHDRHNGIILHVYNDKLENNDLN